MRFLRTMTRSWFLKVALVVVLPVLGGCGGGGGTGSGTGDHTFDPTCTSAFAPTLRIFNDNPTMTISSTTIILDGTPTFAGPILIAPGEMRELRSMSFLGKFLSVSATYSNGAVVQIDFVTQVQCNDLKQAFFQ
jgi:hypothetical protein